MKKNLLYVSIFAVLAMGLIAGTMYTGGSPGKKTGSPKDGDATCAQCHQGSEVKEMEWITTDIPEEGWAPNTTYKVTAKLVHETSIKTGFEITAENEEDKIGLFTITDADRTRFSVTDKAITHKGDGTSPNEGETVWEMEWTSPDVDSGDITFYASFNATDADGSTSGDEVFVSKLTYAQDPSTTDVKHLSESKFKVYPTATNGMLFLESPDNINSVNIYSLSGKNIKSVRNINDTRSSFNISNAERGYYIIKISTDEGFSTRRIQKL